MKYAVVPSRDLLETGRWDAAFHIRRQQELEHMARFQRAVSAEQAMVLVGTLSTETKRRLLGEFLGSRRYREESMHSLIRNYPYFCLSAIRSGLGERRGELRRQAEEIGAELDRLSAVEVACASGKGE